MAQAPHGLSMKDGYLVIGGSPDTINAARDGAAPLKVSAGHAAGETVWLAPRRQQVWGDDAIKVETTHIADTIESPKFGPIVFAWVDEDRLEAAPVTQGILKRSRKAEHEEMLAAERRGRAMVPSCDNCGDCPKCC